MKKILLEEIKKLDSSLLSHYKNNKFKEVKTRLDELFSKSKSHDEKDSLLVMYVTHFYFTENFEHAKEYILKRIAHSPDLVDARIALTEHFHYYEEDMEQAAEAVEIALQKALAEKILVRQVLGIRIRIAIKRKDYTTIDESLLMLLQYEKPLGSLDIAFEKDFITGIESLTGGNALLEQYKLLTKFNG